MEPRSELVSRPADPRLRGLARSVHGYAERTPATVRRRELPGGRAVLIVGIGPELGVRDDGRAPQRLRSFASGMHLAPAVTFHDGEMAGVEIDLTPLGAGTLLGVPMHELSGLTVDLRDLWGERAVRELEEVVAGRATWAGRMAAVEAAVLARAAEAPPPPAELQWAYAQLRRRPVGAIREELGWSHARLVGTFRERVGLAPKAAARVLRFERAVRLLASSEPPARVAAAAGYADQAHLTREVRALSGTTPARLREEHFLQDPMHATV